MMIIGRNQDQTHNNYNPNLVGVATSNLVAE